MIQLNSDRLAAAYACVGAFPQAVADLLARCYGFSVRATRGRLLRRSLTQAASRVPVVKYHQVAAGIALLVIAVCVSIATPAIAAEPPVPPGKATSDGVMVALLGPGIDYRLPELQNHLARDGEGDLIAWDFSDADNKPFEQGGIGNDAAAVLSATSTASLVIVKQASRDPQAFGHMMSFVAKTPARIIVWLNADPARPDWPIMMEAVGHFQDRLFLLPNNHANSSKAFEPLRHLPNVLVHNTYEPTTLTRAIIAAVPVAGFMMGSLAHTAAHIWARDLGQSPAAVKAKLK